MSDKSNIEWTSTRHADGTITPGATWNPIRGMGANRWMCQKISPGCAHTGRVRPVVWKVTADGETPATVVCEQCFRPVAANAVAGSSYTEGEDGWYVPSTGDVHA